MATEFTQDNFQAEVLGADTAVVVDFWAPWCGPCKMLSPVIDKLAGEFDGKVKVGKVNVDDNQALAQEYGIMSIPAVLIFKNGEVVDKTMGFQPEPAMKSFIEKHA